MNWSIYSGLTVANPLLGIVALSVATSVSVYKSLVSRSSGMMTERLPYREKTITTQEYYLALKKRKLHSQVPKEAGPEKEEL